MKVPKIQTVCGFGCGSSLMLRMNVEKIAKEHNYEIEAFCGDVGSCSEELADRIKDRAQVPVVAIKNFMNKKEVEEKALAYLEENCK